MEKEVLVSIHSTQRIGGEAPEETSLVTDGILSRNEQGLVLSYAESELTGMVGTTTTFYIEPERITLERSGTVHSRMVFAQGQEDRSLYDVGFGALMIAVLAEEVRVDMDENGGTMEVSYAVTIEQESAGRIEYRIDVRQKSA